MTSLAKNLVNLTPRVPKSIITWEKAARIQRNEEIWRNPDSIVHRLPEHFKRRYWANILSDRTAVHYRAPAASFAWDSERKEEIELEENPIVGIHAPEADEGLWGGERIVKGWIESRPYTKKKVLPRNWVPKLYFPALKTAVLRSEILDKYIKVTVTERALRLIDEKFGLDYYILDTPEIDLDSKFALRLKRELLLSLANKTYYLEDEDAHEYIREKYASFVIPSEEAEWVGLDLNEAARKQQDLEELVKPSPLKYRFERELVSRLREGVDESQQEEVEGVVKSESLFGEKLLGKYLDPVGKKMRSAIR